VAEDILVGRTRVVTADGSVPILYDAQGHVIRATPEQQAIFNARVPGPGIPLTPAEVRGEEPRAYFPTVGYNLNYVPRSEFPWMTPFEQLRNLAASSWIVSTAVEDVKQQVLGMEWDIHSVDAKAAKRLQEPIARVKKFFKSPDRIHSFRSWCARLLDDALICDALTIYRQRTVLGEPYALKPINGATIKPIVDAFGTPPEPPETAYQQIGYGRVETEFHRPYYSREELDEAIRASRTEPARRPVELVYAPRTTRTYTPYGQGPVERVIILLNVALRRDVFYLAYYTEGNIPEAFWKCPENFTPAQIIDMQEKFEKLLAGEVGARRKLRFMAGGPGAGLENPRGHDTWSKDFDEYLARGVCYAFNTSPLPLVQLMNRATGQMADAEESHSGLHPIREFLREIFTREIHEFLGEEELEFIWTEDKEADERLEMERAVAYVDRAIYSIDEVRAKRGEEPTGIPRYWMTPSGPLFVDDVLADRNRVPVKPANPGAAPAHPLDVPLPPAAGGGSALGPAGGAGESSPAAAAAEALDVPLPPAAKLRLVGKEFDLSQARDESGMWEETGAGEEEASEGEEEGAEEEGGDEDEGEDEAVEVEDVQFDDEEVDRLGLKDKDVMNVGEWMGGGSGFDKMRNPATTAGAAMQETLDKLEPYEGTAYRGMVVYKEQADELMASKEVTLNRNSSASQDLAIARGFSASGVNLGDKVQVLIKVNTKSAADLTAVATYLEESEVVLRAGTKYEQRVVKYDDNKKQLSLEWTEKGTDE